MIDPLSGLNSPFRRVLFTLSLMLVVLVSGTLAFWGIEGWPLFDSFYMTLITLSTVGYGEIRPMSPTGRVIASAIILTGVSVFLVTFALIGDMMIRLELTDYFGNRRRRRIMENLRDHYIVCGAGRVGRSVVRELLRNQALIVLIDSEPARARWALDQDIPTIVGDATQDNVLKRAGIERAKGLVAAISSDAQNVYVVLSARVLNETMVISARATDEQAEQKLRHAGADTVFTPYTFIGHRLAQSLLRPHVLNFLDVASTFSGNMDLDIVTEQLHIQGSTWLVGKTLDESRIRQSYGAIVLAIRKESGSTVFNPPATTVVSPQDVLITMGERVQLERLQQSLSV